MDSLSGNLPQLLIYRLIQLRRECRKAVEMLTPSEKGLAIFRLKGGLSITLVVLTWNSNTMA
jgi:hypothetical protein